MSESWFAIESFPVKDFKSSPNCFLCCGRMSTDKPRPNRTSSASFPSDTHFDKVKWLWWTQKKWTNVLVERCLHPSQSINSQQLTPSVHNCLMFYTPARLKTSDGFFLHRWPVLCLTAERNTIDLLWWMFGASGLHFLHSL